MLYNMFSSDLQTPIFLTDNIGAYRDRVHADTTNGVSTHFPRKRWITALQPRSETRMVSTLDISMDILVTS
jgi:hypothetical protein